MHGMSQFETGYKPTAADGRSGSNPWKAGYEPMSVVGSWVFIVTTKSNYCTISFQLHYVYFSSAYLSMAFHPRQVLGLL